MPPPRANYAATPALLAALVLTAEACRPSPQVPAARPALELHNTPVAQVMSTIATRTGRAVVIEQGAAGSADHARASR